MAMTIADRPLNSQAETIEDAQGRIRLAVKAGFLRGYGWERIALDATKIIRAALGQIGIRDLKSAAARSLYAFAYNQYRQFVRSFGTGAALTALAALSSIKKPRADKLSALETLTASALFRDKTQEIPTRDKGIPNQIYAKFYAADVRRALERIAETNALDPDDVSGSNSLRNRAEMEVRYRKHLDTIDDLRASGVKLVAASVHADCSDRCAPWQGRVYSLDGSTGVTADGKRYVPIETATDIYYTTRAGKTYKNGLLGFNCRHELTPYEPGMTIPTVSEEERKAEVEINRRQRELERKVRDYRAKAEILEGIDDAKAKEYRVKASYAYSAYKRFSVSAGRAYYPSRVQIL